MSLPQLAASFGAIAESMRSCANVADSFANSVVGSGYSVEAAQAFQAMTQQFMGFNASVADTGAPEQHIADGVTPGKGKNIDDGEGPKKRKRTTKPKDPNAPKRPASSYIMFQNEVRKAIKELHPDVPNAEIMSMIADQWKQMTDEQKQVSRLLFVTLGFYQCTNEHF